MKVLVLGGTGFIGSHIVDKLVTRDHFVRIFSRNPAPWRRATGKIEYCLGDLANKRQLDAALKDIDAVCHLVSTTIPSNSNDNPHSDVLTNLNGTLNLIQSMMENGIQKIVYSSSGGTVYGIPDRLPVAENEPNRPICSYGIVKVAIENYLLMYEHLKGLRPVILRPSNPYGRLQGHDTRQGVIGAFARRIANDKEITIWGDGSVVRDFIQVDDLARLFCLALEQDKTGVFNAGTGVGTSIMDIVSLISEATSKTPIIHYQPARPYDVPSIILDVSLARKTFQWEPETSLEIGISQLCKGLDLSNREHRSVRGS